MKQLSKNPYKIRIKNTMMRLPRCFMDRLSSAEVVLFMGGVMIAFLWLGGTLRLNFMFIAFT